jgi:ATP-dependent helicase/nuclease subunit A
MSAGPSPETWLAIAEGLDVKGAGVNAGKLRDVLRRTQGRPALADLRSILVTAQFKPQRGIGGDKTLQHAPDLKAELDAEIERLHTLFVREKQAAAGRRTLDTLLLAEAWLTAYAIEKAHSGKLDFGDLIDRTLALTQDSQMAAWVLFKLDQGLAHVLVDEAQDTSPAQWSILRQLTEDFFAGAGQAGKEGALRRSLFVVGDQKQSIYSFQGASPERLEMEYGHYSQRALAVGAAFERDRQVRDPVGEDLEQLAQLAQHLAVLPDQARAVGKAQLQLRHRLRCIHALFFFFFFFLKKN